LLLFGLKIIDLFFFQTRIWLQLPILVFGVISILAVAFVSICPETFNRPLPQSIDEVELVGLAM